MIQTIEKTTNQFLAQQIVEEALKRGVVEFCVAPGARNAPLVYALTKAKQAKIYYWPEERSAGFFALGRIKATNRPVAVVTTSGTAVAELLPAVMNAHYLNLPLLLLTADRPRSYRGTGSPQTAEQVGIFSSYAHYEQDLQEFDQCDLSLWKCQGAAHINVCFEDPTDKECHQIEIDDEIRTDFNPPQNIFHVEHIRQFEDFLADKHYPFVIVGGLSPHLKEQAIQFLIKLNVPLYAEGFSNLREDSRLAHLRITRIDQFWQESKKYGYPLDAIIRIGEIPTARLWRDLEDLEGQIDVCSIDEHPFSGLTFSTLIHTALSDFFSQHWLSKKYPFQEWLQADIRFQEKIIELFHEEPNAEPSLVYALSKRLSASSHVYLGNSLPIREWDLAATYDDRDFLMTASRGLNGIDGQISTFLGLSVPERSNWAIIGDLTALYDMAGPWVLSQLDEGVTTNVVVINNRGGQIFNRKFALSAFQNPHDLDFAHLAAFWRMEYELWRTIPDVVTVANHHRLIEIVPDREATSRFWQKLSRL